MKISKTGRSIKTRLKELQRYLRSNLQLHSAFVEHKYDTYHQIIFDSSVNLDNSTKSQQQNYRSRN